ncbi:MAG TPA: SMC-Scp complex subunit ScpB [Thermodesulfobacteriota bacterium]|nr:SMC-Scp complex subunit ScpB [Thermodesulfobacteriota bacterium]
MGDENKIGLIEAILFLENEPMDLKTLQTVTNFDKEELLGFIQTLKEEYQKRNHGMEILEMGGGFYFYPKKDYWEKIKERYSQRNIKKLSRAALETLAIIAYSQPITRTEIESIRGVGAEGMIKLLSSQGLVKTVGKKDIPGKPVQYGTTKEFLKKFHLQSISNLPKLDEVDRQKFSLNE